MTQLGRPVEIHKDTVKTFLELIRKGMKQTEAANEVGYSLAGIRIAAHRYGYVVPRSTLMERMKERMPEIRSSSKTQAWWAREFGVSQPAFNKALQLFRQKGRLFYKSKPGPAVDHEKKISEYRQILEYVQKHGGYITDAIKALGLKTNKHYVRVFARKIGFDLNHWKYAWQEYGMWMTLPGPWKHLPPANYLVPAICRGCGEMRELNLCNAKSGRTNGCSKCSQCAREFSQVINTETQEIYPSIMAWVKSIGKLKQYQTLRLKIKSQSVLTIDGVSYEIIKEI